ncbi:MAG: tryptophan--tRNA ligase [bacterium]|nr:tryptophan--tRNA ligase [bacterium]
MENRTSKPRILSGMRPTGKLHLGHYTGALENWVRLQNDYENFHLVADWHVLTTDYEHPQRIWPNTYEMVLDWLAAGIDPNQSLIFRQSQILEHAELHLMLSMLVSFGRLQRNPTFKEQIRDLGLEDEYSYGHIGYPVLQAADILLYKGNYVPVGEDQVPHIELSRELVRRFHFIYCQDRAPIFPEPLPMLTAFARLPGLDRRRMSKSLGNTILLSDSEQEIRQKLRSAITDEQKVRKNDPGHPEICPVFSYQQKFNPNQVKKIEMDCRSGALGCVDCKKWAGDAILSFLSPMQEKRKEIQNQPNFVEDVLSTGEQKARTIARDTMSEVREVMGFQKIITYEI